MLLLKQRGKFIVAGKTVPINRHFDYGAVSFSIDTLDKLNFIMNYERLWRRRCNHDQGFV